MTRLSAFVLLLFAGCGEDVCGCPPVDTSAFVILEGSVVDSAADPVPGAEVSPLGVLGFDCAVDTNTVGADPMPAVSGIDGRLRTVLSTFDGSGTHCVDLLVHVSSSGFTDTIHDVQAVFRHHTQVPDTVRVEVTVVG